MMWRVSGAEVAYRRRSLVIRRVALGRVGKESPAVRRAASRNLTPFGIGQA